MGGENTSHPECETFSIVYDERAATYHRDKVSFATVNDSTNARSSAVSIGIDMVSGVRWSVPQSVAVSVDAAVADSEAPLRVIALGERPRTREGAMERLTREFEPKYRRVIDRLVECPPARRRRLDYFHLYEA